MHRPREATAALRNYVRLVEGGAAVNFGVAASPPQSAGGDDEDDTPPNSSTALTQAFLLLAQAAEQQQDFAGAERWLARVDSPQRALEVQARRASLLARQGKIKEARELIRRVPEQSPGDARAKLLAETDLLRERKMYAEAEQVMAQANKTFPDDTDLLYEQAMLDEKLDRMDEMERLLRRVIALKPDHPARLQRARLLVRRAQDPPAGSARADQEGARAEPGRAVDHRQHGLGRVPARPSRRGDPPAARAPTRRAPTRRSPPTWARSSGAPASPRKRAASSATPARATRRTTSCAKRWRGCASTCDPARPRAAPLARRAARSSLACSAPRCSPPAPRCRPAPAAAPAETLSGRLALRVEPVGPEAPHAVSAAFDLRGNARAGTLGLSTPLGSMLAQARWSPAEVVLVTPRETRRFATLDELTREALGESVPVEAWFDWLRGRPWPGAPSTRGRCAAGGLSPARLARRPRPIRRRHDRRRRAKLRRRS